jgi:hypothetical protein
MVYFETIFTETKPAVSEQTETPLFHLLFLSKSQLHLMSFLNQSCSINNDLQLGLKDHHQRIIGFEEFYFQTEAL